GSRDVAAAGRQRNLCGGAPVRSPRPSLLGARPIMAFTSSKRRQAVRLLLCAALCASAALVSGRARAGGDKKDGKGDLEPFQGGWSVTSINKDKQDIPEELIKELKVSFKGNKL